jgi:hypothetical protein
MPRSRRRARRRWRYWREEAMLAVLHKTVRGTGPGDAGRARV